MITESNRHEVAMLLSEAARISQRFGAVSLAMSGIDDEVSRSSIDELLRSYAGEVDAYFRRAAFHLGYTVSKADQVEDAA